MQIITVAIQKGGTAKTTTAAALAQAAAYRGKSVLAIDLDPQGNLSFSLGAETPASYSSFELLTEPARAIQAQGTAAGLDVIPASWNLSTVTTGKGSATRLQNALKRLPKRLYDIVIIDTPPTAGELQYNALQAATGLIIPLQADIYNLQSLYQITETAHEIQKSNPALNILGLVITKADTRSALARQMQQNIIEAADKIGVPFLGSIRTGVAIQEAAALQKSLFEYAPKSKPAADYMALYEKLEQKKY